jgi:endonuclease/exonuclease/phosphatase family metal-dependent hydrolase
MLTIDHVLVSEDYRAIRTRTVSVPHTDHLALVAELRLGKDE